MPERSVPGKSIVTRRAIVDIVRTAVRSSYGVTGFSDPLIGRRLLRRFSVTRAGVRLTVEEGLNLDLYVTVAHGMPVAEVARQVDSAVRYSVRHFIGVEVGRLGVHVDGLGYQPTAVERAGAVERAEAVEEGLILRDTGAEPPSTAAAADGETAPRKRKAR